MERDTDVTDIALVTGAASGVGLATTTLFLDRGLKVLGMDLKDQPEGLSGDIQWLKGDVTDGETWTTALAHSASAFGGTPTVLVFNAAQLAVGNILDTPPEAFRKLMDVNVHSTVLGLQACLPPMISAGSGSIVVVASTASLFAEQDLCAYGTSKGALIQLARSVAVDYAPHGIRLNMVCPTSIDTPFLRQQTDTMPDPEAFFAAMESRHPMGRILQPSEVASVIGFLVSGGASGMTGSSVLVDCGLTATYDFIRPT
jgi:NAD(P)-dependent dehydrogenase (short-subunit alcohol dehydrogenase family)